MPTPLSLLTTLLRDLAYKSPVYSAKYQAHLNTLRHNLHRQNLVRLERNLEAPAQKLLAIHQ